MEKIVINPKLSSGALRNSSVEELGRKITERSPDVRVVLFPGIGRCVEKSALVADLAQIMAGEGKRILLIDADMRRDKLTGILNPEKTEGGTITGLGEYLSGEKTIDDILCMTDIPGLCAVFAGKMKDNITDMLSDRRLQELINLGMKYFDYILIDCAPADRYRDAEFISAYVDTVVPIVEWKKAESRTAAGIASSFSEIGVPVMGCVLIDVPVDNTLIGRYFRRLLGKGK